MNADLGQVVGAIPRQRTAPTLPSTAIPHWVALSVSPRALAAYWAVKSAPTDDLSLRALARLLGYSRSDKLTSIVTELTAKGAIVVVQHGFPARKSIRALDEPPSWYSGPTDLADVFTRQLVGRVYYASRANGDIKIGAAQDLRWRMDELRKRHGALTLLGSEPGSIETETQRHDQFSWLRIPPDDSGTEWFRPGPALLRHIEDLAVES